MTTEDAIDRFTREYMQYHGLSKGRVRDSVKLLREFAAFADKPLTEVDSSDLQQFVAERLKRYHVNSVRHHLHAIRPFLTWAWRSGEMDAERYMRLMDVKSPRGSSAHSTPKPYSRAEIERFWLELGNNLPLLPKKGRGAQSLNRWLTGKTKWNPFLHNHAMRLQVTAGVRLALDLGLRRAEMFGLTMADLHYDNDYLVVTGKADPNTGHPKIRSVPFTEAARLAVYEWVEFRAIMRPEHDCPWLSCYWREAYAHAIRYRRFQTLLQTEVGPHWQWHRLRHTCATNWLRAGVPLESVSRLLGHSTLQQTLAYAAILKSDVARELGKVEERFAELVGPAVAA